MATIQEIQKDCWNNALHCIGTAYIFSIKAKSAKTRIRLITILGIVVPLCLGGVAATYGAKSSILVWSLIIAGPISTLQLVLSGISLVYKWDDLLAYSLESQSDNRLLSEEYQSLAKNPFPTVADMQVAFNLIRVKDQARTAQDEKMTFTDKEMRKGMRYALWILKRSCDTCEKVPMSMAATECSTCGNF